ncbi:MAG: cellobiose phosphorylase [Deltaproteobacteria bacterium]|nr:cellobiose phosphorylase [Deltaproteobacteria bacterium]
MGRAPPLALPGLESLATLPQWLAVACENLRSAADESKACEWLLDNRHLLERAVRQVLRDLPRRYYRSLPALVAGDASGLPRVYDIARNFASLCALQIDQTRAARFVSAYQEVEALRIGELWAFPTMLRMLCLECIALAVARMPLAQAASTFAASRRESEVLSGLDDTERIARAVRALAAISSIAWNDFVDTVSVVDALFVEDPAGAYAGMRFDTRDCYRKAVEQLARRSRCSEAEVASAALEQARRSEADGPGSHVGYWLVDRGRPQLERLLGARAPVSTRLRRAMARRGVTLYLSGIAAATAAVLAVPVAYLRSCDAGPAMLALGVVLALVPASSLAVLLLHWLVARRVQPRVLPELDFEDAIPAQWRTAVVVPSMLTSDEVCAELVAMLERHYLSNPDPQLVFVLLTDFADAPEPRLPGDDDLLEAAAAGVRRLNEKYRGEESSDRFHLLHRARLYNSREGCWMGWERKRGKLEEWDRLLRGGQTSYVRHEGDAAALAGIRFVITLDADTALPRGAAARLIGILAHPLNRPCFDPASGKVISGYTVVQPRVEIAPESVVRSRFARVYAGDTTIDIYSRAVSDVYQDLFGCGIYVGKGIYDVDGFRRSLEGRVPENAVASHDLFEGVHGRVALATDVILYESFPSQYLAFAQRLHRWTRGDWQLLPWLGARVPGAGPGPVPTRFSALQNWQILDNLRRSLLAPSLLALLGAGWLLLPGNALIWSLLAVAAVAGPCLCELVGGIARWRPWSASDRLGLGVGRRLGEHAQRVLFQFVFLPYEATLVADAIARTVGRLLLTRRKLLEWSTAAQTERRFAGGSGRLQVWRRMVAAPAWAAGLATAVAITRPSAAAVALPFVLLWLAAPAIAGRVSAAPRASTGRLTPAQYRFVRRLARRTWLFFEKFVSPEDHWLPPDNYQEEPAGEIDHRTSPTNIAMLLLSTMSAWDLGYIGIRGLVSRLRNTFDTIGRLEHYRGHLLNWYETRTLEPLSPRYVSTVDSGNYAAGLIAVVEGCREAAGRPVLSRASWDGMMDALGLLEEALAGLFARSKRRGTVPLGARAAAIRRHAALAREDPENWSRTLQDVLAHECADLDTLLFELLFEVNGARSTATARAALDVAALRELRVWLDRVRWQLRSMKEDVDSLLGWLPILDRSGPGGSKGGDEAELVALLRRLLPSTLPLRAIPERCEHARALLEDYRRDRAAGTGAIAAEGSGEDWTTGLDAVLERSGANAGALLEDLERLAARAETEARGTDFRLVYDAAKHLFHLGYNVSSDALDPHHYDLLASECRLTSYVAIAKGDVPVKHWLFLGRPITRTARSPALLSWGGTMFEYLMPRILLRGGGDDLLATSERAAIDAQRAYGRARGVPWGVSESAYSAMDAQHNYQYRAFGVPALGLKRGLEEDLVVAPYASLLAMPIAPVATAQNIPALRAAGALGEYGMRDAIDYTPARLPGGARHVVVKSYMAHHQGMILTALDNFLSNYALVRRFHANPLVKTLELLLRERIPAGVPIEMPHAGPAAALPLRPEAVPALHSWRSVEAGAFPELHAVGNGRMTSVMSDSGGGGISWIGHALTRWIPDATLDDQGVWLYVCDLDGGEVWSVGRQPLATRGGECHVVFHPHMIELRRRERGIAIRLEVAVAPHDDVEMRCLSVVNESDRPRRIALTSYGEVVLGAMEEDRQHPAFSKLFVSAEHLPQLDALLLRRHAKRPEEQPPVMIHKLVAASPHVRCTRVEASRERFLGRHGSVRSPLSHRDLTGDGVADTGLDPIMSIEATLELRPHVTERLAFVTLIGGSRESAVELAERYDSAAALDWAMSDAARLCAREAGRLGVEAERLPLFQRLLSLLLQRHPALRGPVAAIAANTMSQRDLWRMGVSGDLPILLLRQKDPGRTELLRELLRAHALWDGRGLLIDLVIVQAGASGYQDVVADDLHKMLEQLGTLAMLRRRGGVHLLRADQIGAAEQTLLAVAARAVLESDLPLEDQLHDAHVQFDHSPPFAPAEPVAVAPSGALERPSDLLFDNGIGGFSGDGRAYVVHLAPGVSTPAPWSNVLANRYFGTLVTETGGGYTWATNASEHRLTSWRNDPVCDVPSEALYLRDEETAAVWMPMGPSPDAVIEVRHEAGRSLWRQRTHGLEQQVEVLVAADDPVKLIRLRVRDELGRVRRLTATYYAEWVLGTTRDVAAGLLVSEYDAGARALLARNPWDPVFAGRVAFLAAERDPHGVTTDRTEFVGREGEIMRPAALLRWGLSGRTAPGPDPCAALQVHLEIAAGGELETHFVLGEGRTRELALELIERWRAPGSVARAWEVLEERWEHLLGAVTVRTPEPALDLMVNRWALYQTVSSRLYARTGYYQSSGGYGFRDQLQDVMALLHVEPSMAREQILMCAARQFEEGDVLHWWHPPEGQGVRTRCSDDMLWLAFVTAHYVEVTGDLSLLDERVAFLRASLLGAGEEDRYGAFESSTRDASLFDHCSRALERGMTRGSHGLPLMGAGDWNDGMNRVGRRGIGESVWLAWFAVAVANSFARLCELRGKVRPGESRELAQLGVAWRRRASEIAVAVEQNAWDGQWYRRAYDDDGRAWGSSTSRECCIDSIAQSWSVLCGAGDPQRARQALESAMRELVRGRGGIACLLWPPLDRTPRDPGYIKAYPPGVRENGGQYTHAAAWLAWALSAVGDGDGALEVFRAINPIEHARTAQGAARYRVEPYVVAGDIGSAPPYAGRGGWTWYTGSAAWTYRLAVEAILGLRLRGDRLEIDPRVPAWWPEFSAVVRTDGGTLEILVENRAATGRSGRQVLIDGRVIDGNSVELPRAGARRVVHVRIGEVTPA